MSQGKPDTRGKRFTERVSGGNLTPIPVEWMGPAVWRLPSGKALAEFALQTGFLAPLLIGDAPVWRGPATETDLYGGLRRPELRQSRSGFNQ